MPKIVELVEHAISLASFGLTLERLIATFLSSTYEKRCANACIGCFVAIGELCLCGVFSFFYHMGIWGFMTHLSIVTFLDALNVVGLLLLIKQNKSLRKINTLSDIVLSQRYQITENLKTLFELQPMLLSQSLFLVLGTSSGFICSSLHTSRFYVDWSFYVLMNLSVSVLFTAAYIQRKMKAANWKRKVNDQTGVVNAFGQVMEAQQTHNEYFNNLKDQWN
uniref:7TM GPCR serpentine receptor class x (Srx) domain-containing protein n=1 Tax=Panagrellus redivivus TaxID=6233 RepID=A0A7E4UM02_PANRE